ncbi:MAG: hypothetical protein GKR89_09890 [Candidatus Latescibacteria bacterium]|nr:hypothetical protein [Candidatus Latescibacterota bacterium]
MQDLRIAVVQMTSRVGDSPGNIATMERFLGQAAADRVDILCFPELSVSGYTAVCNPVGDNEAGRTFVGVSFICDPRGEVVAQATSSSAEEMVVADLKGAELAQARSVRETFFRHFRRPEIYRRWDGQS